MMLTKEECEKALKEIENATTEIEDFNSIPEITYNEFKNQLNVLNQLIFEHFKNPPLKFEELKENMWVWDNYWEEYFEISEVYSNTKEIDVFIHQNKINQKRYATIKYTPNRFYRKEVQK